MIERVHPAAAEGWEEVVLQEGVEVPDGSLGQVSLAGLPFVGVLLEAHRPVFLDALGRGMWWNFVGRSQQDFEQARRDWMEGSRFGEVYGYDGDRLAAPELPPVPLKPRGRAR